MQLTPATTKKTKALKKLKKKKSHKVAKNDRRYAIIDLGTNSVRFDVYTLIKKKVVRVHRDKRMIRLGDGVYESGQISKAAISRGLEALKDFKTLSEEFGVIKTITFATSALRSAANAEEFIQKVSDEVGIDIEVISGKEECDYIARGIFANLKLPKENLALVDIGGGSTEVTLAKGNKVIKQVSFELGANRLQQLFVKDLNLKGNKKARVADLDVRQFIRKELQALSKEAKKYPSQFIIGSSGTIRNLARILSKTGHSSQPARRQDLSGLVAELRTMNREEILALPGAEPGRVDLLLAGALLFEEIMYFLGAKSFYSTSLSLRDGILQYLLEEEVIE